MTNVNPKMASGAAWMLGYKAAERSISLLSTIILVRLLAPHDFGIVAMAMAMVSLFQLISAFGFDIVIIQRQDAGREHYDTAWTFQVLFGFLIAFLLILGAVPTAAFYNEPGLENIFYALAAAQAIGGFENIGTVAFRKELAFHKEFLFMSSRKFMSFLVVIPLAFWLKNYWALVLGTVFGRTIMVAVSYYAHPFRPRFSLAATSDLFGFSMWLVLNKVIGFLAERAPHFILGKISGMSVLGIFELSYEISNMPTTELTAPINRAVYPAYARISGSIEALRKAYLDVLAYLALFALPAGIGICAIAEPFVHVILGPKWDQAIPLIRILALYGSVTALGSNTSLVYLSMGRPRIITLLGGIKVLLLLPMIVIMTHLHGVTGTAWSILGASLLYEPIGYAAVTRVLKMKVTRLMHVIWRPFLASLFMYWAVETSVAMLSQREILEFDAARLAFGVLAGASCYVGMIFLLWRICGSPQGAEASVFRKFKFVPSA